MVLLAVTVFLLSTFPAGTAHGQVYVAPPPYMFPAPPVVVPVTGAIGVYFAPDVQFEIFFYHGYWWRPWGGRWYRSPYYNGPWYFMPRPPQLLVTIPPHYRRIPPGYARIPYPDLRRHWRTWERDRYWERHREWPERGHGHGGMGRH